MNALYLCSDGDGRRFRLQISLLHRLGDVERSNQFVGGRHVMVLRHTAAQRPRPPHRFRHVVIEGRRQVQRSSLDGGQVPEGAAATFLGVHGGRQLSGVVAGAVESRALALVTTLVVIEHVHAVRAGRQRHLATRENRNEISPAEDGIIGPILRGYSGPLCHALSSSSSSWTSMQQAACSDTW